MQCTPFKRTCHPGCVCVGGGGLLGLKNARMCVSKNGRKLFLFWHQVNEMNEIFSFKAGVIFTCSIYLGDNGLDILYTICPKVLDLGYNQYKD